MNENHTEIPRGSTFGWDQEGREERKQVRADGDIFTLQAWDPLPCFFPESTVWLCWTTECQIQEVLRPDSSRGPFTGGNAANP